jgi:hypothetical protein
MHPDADRLFAQDEALRAEADHMLARSGLGATISAAGYQPVGSYAMRTMTWRDLDFERYQEPDWAAHWELGAQLAATGWPFRLSCIDMYRESSHYDWGLYWGLRAARPGDDRPERVIWKLDLWTARAHEFITAPRERWEGLMTETARADILALKEALCQTPEYRKSILSIHIYEAVLECGIRGLEEFLTWHSQRTE